MSLDWKALSPTRPLDPAETEVGKLYVERRGAGAREVDGLLQAGLDQPIAFFGPAGAGKSTELASLAARRAKTWNGVLVRLDRVVTYGDATTLDDVLEAIATQVVRAVPLKGDDGGSRAAGIAAMRGLDKLLAALRETRRLRFSAARVGLMVDGLEKASEELAHKTLRRLAELRGEADVVVVAPMEAAAGPAAHVLADYHLVSLGPLGVVPDLSADWLETSIDLHRLAGRRLGIRDEDVSDSSLLPAMARAVEVSGGLVRTYLQLLQKSALYAAVRGAQEPTVADVRRAEADQTAFMVRLLKEGDAKALRDAHGTPGLEVETSRKIRFLANGLLLEYASENGPVMRVAPLLAEAVEL